MHPQKVKDLVPSFAMQMGRPVEEVRTVMSFYYKTIRQKLSNLEAVNVHLENLGKFYLKEKAIDSYMEKCEYIINTLSNNTIKEYASKVEYQEKLNIVKKAKEYILEERDRRKQVINKRFNNESGS